MKSGVASPYKISGPFPVSKTPISHPMLDTDYIDAIPINVEPKPANTSNKGRLYVKHLKQPPKPGHVTLLQSMHNSTGMGKRYVMSRSTWYARKRAMERRKQSQVVTGFESPSDYLYWINAPRIVLKVQVDTLSGVVELPISNISRDLPGYKRIPEIGPPLGETGSCSAFNYLGSKKIDPLTKFIRRSEQCSDGCESEAANPTGYKMFRVHLSLGKLLRHKHLNKTPFWDNTWHPLTFTSFRKLNNNIKPGSYAQNETHHRVLFSQLMTLNQLLIYGCVEQRHRKSTTPFEKTLAGHLCCTFAGQIRMSRVKSQSRRAKIARMARKEMRMFGFHGYYNALKEEMDASVETLDWRKKLEDVTRKMTMKYSVACTVVFRVVTAYKWLKVSCLSFQLEGEQGCHLQSWIDCMLDMAFQVFHGGLCFNPKSHNQGVHEIERQKRHRNERIYGKTDENTAQTYDHSENNPNRRKRRKKSEFEISIESSYMDPLKDEDPCPFFVNNDAKDRLFEDIEDDMKDHFLDAHGNTINVGFQNINLGRGRFDRTPINFARKVCLTDDSIENLGIDLRLYPHGRRFVAGSELIDLGSLLIHGNIWRETRPTTKDRIAQIIHLLLTKTRHHKCSVRNIYVILQEYCKADELLECLIKDIIHISMMGMFPGAMVRPDFLARMYIRRDSMAQFRTNHRHMMKWCKENEKIVWYCMKEYYYYTLRHNPAIFHRTQQSKWDHEHMEGVYKGMDSMRKELNRIYAEKSCPVNQEEAFGVSKQDLARLRRIIRKENENQSKYLSKLRKGTFSKVILKEMQSWDAREDKTWAIYKYHQKGFDISTEPVMTNPREDWKEYFQGNHRENTLVSNRSGKEVKVVEDLNPIYFKKNSMTGKRNSALGDTDEDDLSIDIDDDSDYLDNSLLDISSEEDAEDDSPGNDSPRKKRYLSVLDIPRKLFFKERPTYPQDIIEKTKKCERNLKYIDKDTLMALYMLANYLKTRKDGVFEFWWLYAIGVSLRGIQWLKTMYYMYEMKDIPDNQLKTRMENFYGPCPRDYYLTMRLLRIYHKKESPECMWLGENVAKRQIEACRAKFGMLSWHRTDYSFIGNRKYCVCGQWAHSVASHTGDDTEICFLGLVNSVHDVSSGKPMCNKAEYQCQRYPYQEMNVIGISVKMGKNLIVACSKCGSLIKWNSENVSEFGPDCGYHDSYMVSLSKYNGNDAFVQHKLRITTPEMPDRVNMDKVRTVEQRIKNYHNGVSKEPLTPDGKLLYKVYRLMDKNYRGKLNALRASNICHWKTIRTTSMPRYCIYCMSYIPPGSGGCVWVVVNGMKKEQDIKHYEALCNTYQRIIHRIPPTQIYQQLDACSIKSTSDYSFYKKRTSDQQEDVRLQMVHLCPVDLRNARKRIIYDLTTMPFLEDLYRWIDSSARRKISDIRKNKNRAMRSFQKATQVRNSMKRPSQKFFT